MTPLTFQVLATFVATLVVLVVGMIGVKKSDPLMVLAAVFFAIPTIGLGTGSAFERSLA